MAAPCAATGPRSTASGPRSDDSRRCAARSPGPDGARRPLAHRAPARARGRGRARRARRRQLRGPRRRRAAATPTRPTPTERYYGARSAACAPSARSRDHAPPQPSPRHGHGSSARRRRGVPTRRGPLGERARGSPRLVPRRRPAVAGNRKAERRPRQSSSADSARSCGSRDATCLCPLAMRPEPDLEPERASDRWTSQPASSNAPPTRPAPSARGS